MVAQNFELLRRLVERCQAAGILSPGEPDVVALGAWGLVHGFVSLVLEGQVSRAVTGRYSQRELMILTLNQITRQPIDLQVFGPPPGRD